MSEGIFVGTKLDPYTKALVEESAVPILNERITSLQTTVHNLQSLMFKLERDFQTYTKATQALAEQLKAEVHIRSNYLPSVTKDGKKHYARYVEAVKDRWSEWKRQYESGMKIYQIARTWGVDHESVRYALSKNWIPSERNHSKKGNNESINLSAKTDNRPNRFVRGGHQQTKQCGESQRICSPHSQIILRRNRKFRLRRTPLGYQGCRRKATRLGCA